MSTSATPVISTQLLAEHEASHAVMRVLLLGDATRTWISPEGGYSEGTGLPISEEALLWIQLAGFAWEAQGKPICWLFCQGQDFDQAEYLLRNFSRLRCRVSLRTKSTYCLSVPLAVSHHMRMVWVVLKAYESAILKVAALLVKKKVVEAKDTLKIVRACKPQAITNPEVLRILHGRHHNRPRRWSLPASS